MAPHFTERRTIHLRPPIINQSTRVWTVRAYAAHIQNDEIALQHGITLQSFNGWTDDEWATLRAELVETVTRLAGWADADNVEVIG